jgi:plastocyanin
MKIDRAVPVVVLMILATQAQAGMIRGRLRLGAPARPTTPTGAVLEQARVTDAVVWVDSLPPTAERRYRGRPLRARVIQSNRRFSPRVSIVMVGSTIDFANRDRVYHNVFSVSPAQRFDLGKYPPRETLSVTFEHPGVVNLFCDIHPWMAAYVVVLTNRVYARPSRTGEFRLPVLPPGPYTLHFWHPSIGEKAEPVRIPDHGDAVLALSERP